MPLILSVPFKSHVQRWGAFLVLLVSSLLLADMGRLEARGGLPAVQFISLSNQESKVLNDSAHAAHPVSIDGGAPPTAQLLSDYAKLLNRFGPDSAEADAFLREHEENSEFFELARLSATLKRALSVSRRPVTPRLTEPAPAAKP